MSNAPVLRISRVGQLLTVALLCTLSVHAADAQAPDPRREPATALREGVRLLESKAYTQFVKMFVIPRDLEGAIKKYGSLEHFLVELNRSAPLENTLKVFQAALKVDPTFNPSGTSANYPFEAPIGGARRLQLQKIDGLWYWAD